MASKKSKGKGAAWILLALLILGLGGFGATSFSGNINSVGSVGGKSIRVDSYSRELQNQMASLGQQIGQTVTIQQAQAFGLPDAVMNQLVTNRALDAEADRIGLSIGDGTLRDQIVDISAFKGPNGSFDRETYKFALDRAGMTEEEFESDLREETSRSILQAAVVAATRMPATYADTLVNYLSETRAISMVRMNQDNLDAPIPAPTEAELKAYYDAHSADYTAPEKKRITYAMLSPDSLIATVPVDETAIKQAYEARKDEFEQPERRLVERLVYPDQASAEAAKAKLDAGEADFETLVKDRGLELTDIDLGDVSKAQLGAAGDAIFAAESGTVVGPLQSDLGPALFRINGVLAANNTDYGTASLMIREELAADAARRAVQAQEEPTEDLLAGGATLEDLAKETDLTLGTIDWYDGLSEGIAAYADFDNAARELTADDYPEIAELDDGGIFAMRLDETIPAAPEPFEDVKDRVARNWEADQTDKALQAKAQALMDKVTGGATLEDAAAELGLEVITETAVTRNGAVLGTPQGFNADVFDMKIGDLHMTSGFGAVIVARLDQITPPAADDEGATQLRTQLNSQLSSSLAQEVYTAYANKIRNSMDVRIDQDAVNAVIGQFR